MLAELEVSPEDPGEVFELLTKLGSGSYASVYKALDKRDGTLVAIKVLEIDSEDTSSLIKEIRILKECKNPFIVDYHGSFMKDGHLWIAMEYCGMGSVCDIMQICDKLLTEDQAAAIMKMALTGLEYLHSLNMIHRDIKSANILLTHGGECKLADFGVSAELESTLAKRKTLIGTPYWMAPEVVQSAEYDTSADIWSLGITAYEMVTGAPPHVEKHPMRAIFIIPTAPAPTLPDDGYSEEFHDFLRRALQKDNHKRATATELLKHSFVARSPGAKVVIGLVDECRDEIDEYRENQSDDGEGDDEGDEDEESENEGIQDDTGQGAQATDSPMGSDFLGDICDFDIDTLEVVGARKQSTTINEGTSPTGTFITQDVIDSGTFIATNNKGTLITKDVTDNGTFITKTPESTHHSDPSPPSKQASAPPSKSQGSPSAALPAPLQTAHLSPKQPPKDGFLYLDKTKIDHKSLSTPDQVRAMLSKLRSEQLLERKALDQTYDNAINRLTSQLDTLTKQQNCIQCGSLISRPHRRTQSMSFQPDTNPRLCALCNAAPATPTNRPEKLSPVGAPSDAPPFRLLIRLACLNLPTLHESSGRVDPLCAVFVRANPKSKFNYATQTDWIMNDACPVFNKAILLQSPSGESGFLGKSEFRFSVYDVNNPKMLAKQELIGHVIVAAKDLVEAASAQQTLFFPLKASPFCPTFEKFGDKPGLQVRTEILHQRQFQKVVDDNSNQSAAKQITFQFRCKRLPAQCGDATKGVKIAVMHKDDVYPESRFVSLARTESARGSCDPSWNTRVTMPFEVGKPKSVRFAVYFHEVTKHAVDTFVGDHIITIDDLLPQGAGDRFEYTASLVNVLNPKLHRLIKQTDSIIEVTCEIGQEPRGLGVPRHIAASHYATIGHVGASGGGRMAGYMYKKGYHSKGWLKRYFVLRNAQMQYYKSEKDINQKPKGSFLVKNAVCEVFPPDAYPFQDSALKELMKRKEKKNNRRNSIFATFKNKDGPEIEMDWTVFGIKSDGGRTYFLVTAQSAEYRESWIKVIGEQGCRISVLTSTPQGDASVSHRRASVA